MEKDDYQQLLEKYKSKIKEEFGEAALKPISKISSREYSEFKEELYPTSYSLYEKACNFSEKLLHLKPDVKKEPALQKNIDICHLNITPSGAISLSILLPIFVIFIGALFSFVLFQQTFLVIFFAFAGLLMIPALQNMPNFMANTWRMKSSNQMVQSIFYMVTFMRHTSNIERAIEFAADHLEPPLSLDFRKILWDVESQKFSSIKDSADTYLQSWKEWNKEFVEAFHLVESSLYESSEERRLALLDKALDVILDGTYENMLHYAHSLQSPITMLHMMGVILPILGLVILPLVVSFMTGPGTGPGTIAMYIAVLYNVSLPIGVYYLGKTILSKRPSGYGNSDPSEKPGMKQFKQVTINFGKDKKIGINPFYFSFFIFLLAMLIGFSPMILHTFNPEFELQDEEGQFQLEGYICQPCQEGVVVEAGACGPSCDSDKKVGPYGLGASLLSLVIIGGMGLAIGLFFALRSKNVIGIREKTKALEEEFSSAMFQLGNRLGDGIPAEIAFAKVADNMRGTTSGDFFNIAERNMTKLGMGLEQAIFDSKVGALVSFPSKVIESSMKVLIESIKKGPRIAAQALLSMSRYIKEIHRVEERLKDLMSEVLSSMKSQIKVLTPAIAGIVIGITSMISTILTRLSAQLTEFSMDESGGWGSMLNIFGIGMPTFYFQVIVGIYIVQITYILTVLSNGIENGVDPLGERYNLGKNMINSTLLYCFLAGAVMLLFNFFANSVLSRSITG